MKIKGKVSRTFHSMDSGFKIMVLEVSRNSTIPEKYRNPDFPMSVSIVGNLKNVYDEYVVEITGEWEHRENGKYWPWQFKVERYTVCDFETPCILIDIIGSLNKFGRSRAKRMVEIYGTDIVHILESEPQVLTAWETRPGEIEALSKEFKKYRAAANLKAFLSKYGIEEQIVDDIHERWGLSAVDVICKNPYILCKHKLVPFLMADKIAKDCEISADNAERVDTVLLYVLNDYAGGKGHTFLRVTQLPEDCNSFLKDNCEIQGSLNKRHIEAALSRFLAKGDIVIEGDSVYSRQRYESETVVANILISRIGRKARYRIIPKEKVEACVAEIQEELEVELDPLQREAVEMALCHQTSVLTGGAGCGKTTTLRFIISAIEKLSKLYRLPSCEIALAAPTGMAAKRMMASTDKEARTIHKLIEYNPALPLLTLNEDNPLTYDFVIVDELSMVDIDTMAMLLRAVRDDTQLLFLGDVHQLPSIGPGEVLHDIINSNVFPVTALKRSFRHGSRKTILENANRVLEGITELDFGHSDCLFYDVPDSSGDKNCRRLMKMLLKVYYEEYAACGRKAEKIQVLSPMRVKTLVSVDQINPELQDLVNALIDEEDEVRIGSHRFRKNDRVMQVSNNYDKNVYNGDKGVVKMVSDKSGRVLVDYDGTPVEYSKREFDQLKHSFAITVHKSQGDQFPIVIIPITNYHSVLLTQNLLYTAMTRAKQKLIFVGDKDALEYAIRNTQGLKRNTALCDRLKVVEQKAA